MPTYTITFDQQETAVIYQTFEQIPLSGPENKQIAASIQAKIAVAVPDPEPDPEPDDDPDGELADVEPTDPEDEPHAEANTALGI